MAHCELIESTLEVHVIVLYNSGKTQTFPSNDESSLRRDDLLNSPPSVFVLKAHFLFVCLHCESQIYNANYSKTSMEATTVYVLEM